MPNYKIIIQYDGFDYSGWQVQPDKRTIQGEIRKALNKITGHKLKVIGSGRTDAGVHAMGQVANFKTSLNIEEYSMLKALNTLLPKDIRIINSKKVNDKFNAISDCIEKKYRYNIYNDKIMSPFENRYALYYPYKLNISKMKKASKILLGKNDFSAFTSKTSKENCVRDLKRIRICKSGNIINLIFVANGFLRYMVRILVGTLIDIGRGKIELNNLKDILNKKDRTKAGKKVEPQGLYLDEAKYNPESERIK